MSSSQHRSEARTCADFAARQCAIGALGRRASAGQQWEPRFVLALQATCSGVGRGVGPCARRYSALLSCCSMGASAIQSRAGLVSKKQRRKGQAITSASQTSDDCVDSLPGAKVGKYGYPETIAAPPNRPTTAGDLQREGSPFKDVTTGAALSLQARCPCLVV